MFAPLVLALACTTEPEKQPVEEEDYSCPEGQIWLGHACGEPEVEDSAPDTDADDTGARDDTGPSDDTGGGGPCRVIIDEALPNDGQTGVYYRTEVEWHLSQDDPSAALSIDGVPGTSTVVDDKVFFQPDSPLAPSTEYTVWLAYCDGERRVTTSFTTSATGAAVTEGDLVGQTWLLDLPDGRVVEPEGVGSLLESYLEVGLLMQAVAADSASLDLRLASGDGEGSQELCAGTVDLVADFSENPYFATAPQDTTLPLAGDSLSVEDMVITGAVTPDGSGVEGLSLAGSVDTRPLVDLVEEGGDDDVICDLMAGFGVSCVTCESDGAPLCVDIRAIEVTGQAVSGSLTEVPGDCHESCLDEAGECPEASCASVGARGGAWLALAALLGLAGRRRRRA